MIHSIKYLVGNKNFKIISKNPFNEIICNFVSEISKNLNQNIKNINYPDVKTFAFWCRKQNILNLKKKYFSNSIRLGHGLIFHITPSNIPTNFAYSLMFGLLTGNSNIVKVPSKKFEQVKIICDCIKKILKKKKYISLRGMISIIRYRDDEYITKQFSSICDVRLIWGGDNSIKNIRKFNLKERAIDIAFADRFSFCVINSNEILKLKKFELRRLIEKFYNDTYLVDQNACSSPHLIVWTGQRSVKAKKIFWDNLYDHVSKKYNLPEIASIDKYSKLFENILKKNIKTFKMFGNLIYVVTLKNLSNETGDLRGKWGYFYQYDLNDLNKVAKFVNKKFQTLTYFGLSKKYLTKFVIDNNLNGIDRIVPIGQALDIGFEWDGYDMNRILSRVIELK